MKTAEDLKNFVYPNGKYSNIKANSQLVKKHFPDIYESIKDNYKTKLYMLMHNINEIPKCKNKNCSNSVQLKSIGEGFRKFCCNKCIAEYQKTDDDFAKKISKKNGDKGKLHLRNKYPDLLVSYDKSNKNYLIIEEYCKHGNVRIYTNTFKNLYEQKKCLCEKCKLEKAMDPSSENDIEDFQQNFSDFYKKNSLAFKKSWFITNFPREYSIILNWSKHIENIPFPERVYLFKHQLKDIPKCKNPSCNNKVTWNPSNMKYNILCKSYSCVKNISGAQVELYEFVSGLGISCNMNKIIQKSSYDIVAEEHKLLFEYNGIYWHSTKFRTPRYHYDKYLLAKENGFSLFTIWEDEWLRKRPIVESMIRNKLHLNPIKIHARKCAIRPISSKENHDFCDMNHVQGKVSASIRYGLFHEGELVSAMTFGKKRAILGVNHTDNEYELLRFCNSLNTSVVGGASKLFKHFLREHVPSKVVSYASCDHSSGGLYEVLGFKNDGHAGLNYWWAKDDVRFHRSQFMKHKLVKEGFDESKTEDQIMDERGYVKVYGSGNVRYVWVVADK